MNEEIWKDIPGYEGRYKASNLGRILSLIKYNNNRNKDTIIGEKCVDKQGYCTVSLRKEKNKRKTYKVHRLIAMTFLSDYKEELTVDHIDNNKTNNNVKNLRMCSLKDNIRNPNSSHIKSCRIYFNNGEIKEFPSAASADEYFGTYKLIKNYCNRGKGSEKYGFKKAEYI